MTCLSESQGRHISFGHDDNITAFGKQVLMKTKKFSYESFDSVSFYGVSRFSGDGDAEPSFPLWIIARYNREIFGTSPHPLVINCFKSASFRYPFRLPV